MAKKKKELSDIELMFEEFYSPYPRRGEGRAKGFKKFKILLRDGVDLDDLIKARDNYIRMLEREGRPRMYTKIFSTFMNNWSDYLNIDEPDGYGGDDPQSPISLAEMVMNNEL